MFFKRLSVIAIVCLLSSCSFLGGRDKSDSDPSVQVDNVPEKLLYDQAQKSLDSGQARTAVEYLQAIEAQFPFGPYAEQSQLDLIFAYYRSGNSEGAQSAAERFIRLHPEHPNVDYAYYMRGLVAFTEDVSFIGSFIPTDVTRRDPGSARDSYAYFSDLLTRFPNSKYGPDARKRLLYMRNLLARHEINVANYYFKRGAILAATNRGRFVVENFQGSPAVPDGLAVMAQGYIVLGYEEQANNAISVLQENYPEHPALDENGNFVRRDILAGQQRSFLNRASFGLLQKPEPLGYDTRKLYNSEYAKESKVKKDKSGKRGWWRSAPEPAERGQ